MSTVTTKQLHLETKAILDRVEAGQPVVITRNGRPLARIEPVGRSITARWKEVMQEVWTAQKKIEPSDRVTNQVLLERQRRRR